MDYQNLEKIYYKDNDPNKKKYEEIYQAYLTSPSTIILNIDTKDKYPMFCVLTKRIFELIYGIKEQEIVLNNIKSVLPIKALEQFAQSLLVDEIKLTNEIEGVRSTKREIQDIIDAEKQSSKNKRLFNLVKKYEKLSSNEQIPLETCEDVRKLYDEIVLPEILQSDEKNKPDGLIFRKEKVFVHDEKKDIIHMGLFPEENIINTMNKTLQIIKDKTLNPLVTIAVVHYLIGYIHPFYDGNGRLNRFISSYLLSNEIDSLVGYCLSYTIKTHKQKYDKLFKSTNNQRNRGDLTIFVSGFLEIVFDALKNIIDNLYKKEERLEYYSNIIDTFASGAKSSFLFLLLQASLFSDGLGLTASDIVFIKENSISKSTVINYLKQYQDIIKKSTQRKYAYLLDLDKVDEFYAKK